MVAAVGEVAEEGQELADTFGIHRVRRFDGLGLTLSSVQNHQYDLMFVLENLNGCYLAPAFPGWIARRNSGQARAA